MAIKETIEQSGDYKAANSWDAWKSWDAWDSNFSDSDVANSKLITEVPAFIPVL